MDIALNTDFLTSRLSPQKYLRLIGEAGFTHLHWCHQWNTDYLYSTYEIAQYKKWLQEYQLSMDVVKMACERTVLQTGKASFAYADKILASWKDVGVKTVADVEAQDKAFAAKKAQNTPAENLQYRQHPNRTASSTIPRVNGTLLNWSVWKGNIEKNGKDITCLGGATWLRKHRSIKKCSGNTMPCVHRKRRNCVNAEKPSI